MKNVLLALFVLFIVIPSMIGAVALMLMVGSDADIQPPNDSDSSDDPSSSASSVEPS